MSLRFPAIVDPNGHKLADVIDIFSLVCPACRQPIYPATSLPIYALGPPYFCVIHRDCIHSMMYNGAWPHNSPMSSYFSNSPPTFHSLLDQRPPEQ